MLKKIISIGMIMSFFSVTCPITSFAQENKRNSIIQPYAHIIEWRYKKINGIWHKRQYDYTAQKWLGSWKPV